MLGLFHRLGHIHAMACIAQTADHHVTQHPIVFDNKNSHARDFAACANAHRNSVITYPPVSQWSARGVDKQQLPVSPEIPMTIKSQKDFYSGVMFTSIGVAFAWGATTYNVGAGARMGPGYFPLMLGIVLSLLGAAVMLRALVVETEDGDKIGQWAWKPLGFIIAGNLLFGILLGGLPSIKLPAMGLVLAIYGLTFVVSYAGERVNLKEVFVLATILSIGSYLAFVVLLKLQFPVWPTFITG